MKLFFARIYVIFWAVKVALKAITIHLYPKTIPGKQKNFRVTSCGRIGNQLYTIVIEGHTKEWENNEH